MAFAISALIARTGTIAPVARRMLAKRIQATPSFPYTSSSSVLNVLPFRNTLASIAMVSFVRARAPILSATDTSAPSVTTRISAPAARLFLVLLTTVHILLSSSRRLFVTSP